LIIKIIAYFGILLLIVNGLLFIRVAAKQDKAFKIFTIYLMVMVLIQISTAVLQFLSMHNIFLSHFYLILQFILLSLFYLEILPVRFQKRVIKIAIPSCLAVLAVQYYLDATVFFRYNLWEIFITSFLIIIFAMFHFYNLLNEKKTYYYLSIGIFVYLFGSTFIFITGNLLVAMNNDFGHIIWIMNSLLYIVYQVYIFLEYKHRILNKKGSL
jgi:hypothetical protein